MRAPYRYLLEKFLNNYLNRAGIFYLGKKEAAIEKIFRGFGFTMKGVSKISARILFMKRMSFHKNFYTVDFDNSKVGFLGDEIVHP